MNSDHLTESVIETIIPTRPYCYDIESNEAEILMNPSYLLSDQQLWDFIVNGYVTVQTRFPAEFHADIWHQAKAILEQGPNPWNEIYPMIPQLADVFADPAVDGALATILGPGYIMHPHRHCHFNPPGNRAQGQHKDSYEEDENVRHHRTRWAMGFYYPQDVTLEMGPSAIQPGTQYYNSRAEAKRHAEIPLTGKAGTVILIHYDLWHRALANQSDQKRFMLKFLFCRMEEPRSYTDRVEALHSKHTDVANGHEALWRHMWHWYKGQDLSQINGHKNNGNGLIQEQIEALHAPSEAARLDAAYALGDMGADAVPALMENLHAESALSLEANLKANHTNPSELYTGHALAAVGEPAVPVLSDALMEKAWWVRAAAADILGDIGLSAKEAVPALTGVLHDESEWVRRNATESLGTLGMEAKAAVMPLTQVLLNDDVDWVRHNAALALARIGPAAEEAIPTLKQALDDENLYVSGNSRIALDRIE